MTVICAHSSILHLLFQFWTLFFNFTCTVYKLQQHGFWKTTNLVGTQFSAIFTDSENVPIILDLEDNNVKNIQL